MGEPGSDGRAREVKLQKSYFDVLGLCCSSEVPLIERILKPLDGIEKVSVIVPSRTVIVVHDSLIISQLQIEKALNQARLEATIRSYGTNKIIRRWPSPYILACGALLVVSLFHHFYRPLKWLALAAVAIGLPPIILRSIATLRRYTLDINILMLIAVGGAVAMKDYLEAGFIVFLFTIAEWLESRASHKATAGMSSLLSLAPQKAVLAETGEVVDARDVKIDTILAIKAGEVIPIDGIVVEGKSEVDERTLTGESFPVAKQPESLVWAGTLNIDGYISVKTTALAEHSAVAKMASLVEEAQNSRSKTQRLIDSCAKYYTPAVVILAAGVAVFPLVVGVHRPKKWFRLALVLLISACPCALVLSTPVATFCSLLKAARMGLLIKGGDVLEALAKTKVVALDKTGTITRGEFIVMEFQPIDNDITLAKLFYWVSSIESKSSHPMASALVDYARSNSIDPKPENVTEFRIYPGEGIYGEIDGRKIYVGNRRLATRAGCQTVPNMEDVNKGVTLGYVFSGAVPIGIFTLSDNCRTGAAEAIRELKSLGIKTAMVTGDSSAASEHAQKQLGHTIEMVHAELLPEDKVTIIKDLKTKEGTTTMVGDGMNDAPALAAADVGISMGISGSAVAMETSHITLMSNDVRKIPKAIRLARRTHRKIIINILLSVSPKIAILALAFAGHPLLWAAVLADVGTCLVVILNSMMLLQTRKPKEKKCCGSSQKSNTEKKLVGGCCASTMEAYGKKDGCSSSERSNDKREKDGCCRSDRKQCGGKDGCSFSQTGTDKTENGSCCKSDRKECSGSSQKSHAPSKPSTDQGVRGTCGAQILCCQSNRASCSRNNGCQNHDKEVEERAHGNWLGACEKQGCHKGAPNHSHRSSESIPDATKGVHEHLVSITCEEHNENEHLVAITCKHTDQKLVGGCCASSMEAYGKEDGCASSEGCNEKREKDGCCRSDRKQCGREDGCSFSQTDKRENGSCCKSDRTECGKEGCCSSSQTSMNKREISGCCTSYRKEFGMKDGCCGHRTPQLPEIIVE